MITQTWLGHLFCRLGFHLVIVAARRDFITNGTAHGGCIRCNRSFQWDY